MKIFVGSTNPVKIAAVKKAAETIWKTVIVRVVETESGVSAQPMSDTETKTGSINRAKNALKDNTKKSEKNNHVLGIGLEGGVYETENGEMWNTVWVSIIDKNENTVSVNGSRFLIPKNIAEGIRNGEEMGVVVDKIAGVENIHHKEGFIGYMTNSVVTRTDEYANLAKLALGIWIKRN